ncbi:MAG: hypothetical protein AAGI46_01345 [Planctomycetota bacterium]
MRFKQLLLVPVTFSSAWAFVSSPAIGSEIFWSETNSDAVFGANVIDGSGQRKIRDLDDTGIGEANYSITGLALADDFLYFTAAAQDRIFFASTSPGGTPRGLFLNLDNAFGGGVDYRPQGITANSDHVFWTDRETRTIYRADTGLFSNANNRTGVSALVTPLSASTSPREIKVVGNDLYWTDTGVDAIFRSNLDGTGTTQIVDLDSTFGSGSYFPGTITATSEHVYWSDIETDIIYRADRDGSNAIELIDTNALPSDGPLGLVTDSQFLYWTTFAGNEIVVATLDGTIVTDRGFTPSPDPTVSGFNVNALAIAVIPEPLSAGAACLLGGLALRRRRVTFA